MTRLYTLQRHNALALSKTNTMDNLLKHSQKQVFDQKHVDASDVLLENYTSDAAIVQYTLTETKTQNQLPIFMRLKEESLKEIDRGEIQVHMNWVILDWDLPSKGVLWGDENKPESQEHIKSFIESHPKLKYAYAHYFSKSGVRVIFQLSNPLELETSEDVLVWKAFYKEFINKIDISEIGGDIELRADPFILSRVPNYVGNDGIKISGEVTIASSFKPLKVTYPQVSQPTNHNKQNNYTPLPLNQVAEALWNEPLIRHLRKNGTALHYKDWRAIGTNVAALLGGEKGLGIFHEISSWDRKNYNPSAVESHWNNIVASAENYGPTTWSQFIMDLSDVYNNVNPKACLAVQVRKVVENAIFDSITKQASAKSAKSKQLPDNSQDVYQNLFTVTKVKNGEAITQPTKCTSNLITILTQDNRWKDLIKRNHLGSVDMIGDERVQDEHISSMREIISRVYGLTFSKDDCWDYLKLVAQQNEYHPVQEYLDSLKWDGVDRVSGLCKALGQQDPFAEIVMRKFLISCVVRPLEWNNFGKDVNWKIDTVLILKGSQGKRKSSFFKALCADEEWFSDNLPSITSERKDASLHMLGKWIVEQAEFEGHVARSSVENMKAFITREREIFRKPYGRAEINMRRPSVLVGTTNSSSFLNDPTGDRRFWVLEIPENHTIDLKWVMMNREQLWSQAVHLYRKNHMWWLTEQETLTSNTKNQKFRRPDALHEAILEFLNTSPTMANIKQHPDYEDGVGFTLKQLVSIGLDKKLADLKSYETQNITSYLAKMGYLKIRTRVENQRMYIFRKLKDFDDEEVF